MCITEKERSDLSGILLLFLLFNGIHLTANFFLEKKWSVLKAACKSCFLLRHSVSHFQALHTRSIF